MSLFTRKPKPSATATRAPAMPLVETGSHTGPAISLTKMQAAAPGLVDLYKKAGVSLRKRDLEGVRAAVYLVLDYSGSMAGFYGDGTVQALAERVLAAAAHFDDDGTVPVVFFGYDAHPVETVKLDNYRGRIAALATGRSWGSTNYSAAMNATAWHYRASRATHPALVVFLTDGEPDSRELAEQALHNASSEPIFWQFVGIGDNRFSFLQRLDTLSGRAVDNAGFFAAGADPRTMPDEELYDRLLSEFPQWLAAARTAGILR